MQNKNQDTDVYGRVKRPKTEKRPKSNDVSRFDIFKKFFECTVAVCQLFIVDTFDFI